MTAANLPPAREYIEDGTTLAFAAPFRFLAASDLEVKRILASGAVVELAPGTAWSATGGQTDAGGTVTLAASVAGARIRIRRRTTRAQQTDYATGDTFPAESHEGALDRLALVDQEQDVSIADLATRAPQVPEGETAPPFASLADLGDGDILEYRAGALRRFDRSAFAGRFYAGDGVGAFIPASGTGADSALRTDLADPDIGAGLLAYRAAEDPTSSITNTGRDMWRRQRPNAYDRVPRHLWPAIEAGTLTDVNLGPYLKAGLSINRALDFRAGEFPMNLVLDEELIGADIRCEGRHFTVFKNVDDDAVVTLDSSNAEIFGFNIEGAYFRSNGSTTCDGIKILGAGNGEGHQNDKHHFEDLWIFGFRDGIACYSRAIWVDLANLLITGCQRDAIHIEVSANVNQWSIRDTILKGAGRFGLFFKHDLTMSGADAFTSLATGWTLQNVSTEDCGYEGWRFLGSGGVQCFAARQGTYENNGLLVPTGTTPTVDGIARRKANVHVTVPYFIGCEFSGNTFYNGNGIAANNPDAHLYVESAGSIEQTGSMENNRFLATQSGVDVVWPRGLTYHANNVNSGALQLDRTFGSVDARDALFPVAFTPALQFGGATTGMAITNQAGRFVVNGRNVQLQLYFAYSAKGSATGQATIAGLPFPALNAANLAASLSVEATGLEATAATDLYARVLPGEEVIRLYRYEAGTEYPLVAADFGTGSVGLRITGSYML